MSFGPGQSHYVTDEPIVLFCFVFWMSLKAFACSKLAQDSCVFSGVGFQTLFLPQVQLETSKRTCSIGKQTTMFMVVVAL
jgi:hypothetical protein